MKEFFVALTADDSVKRDDIVEKDYHLHRILYRISQESYFKDNLVFKGGTCLIKAYLTYFRFSEDLDFTWRNKDIWNGETKSQCARRCSAEITTLCDALKVICEELGFDFSGNKADTHYVQIHSGGRMVTFKIYYDSEMLGHLNFIKLEVNFVEDIIYPITEYKLKSYIEGIESEQIKFLHEEQWEEYTKEVVYPCYDAREIFVEKVRASLTRIAFKVRDAVDIYYLEKEMGFKLADFKDAIKQKINFTIKLYQKYGDRLEIKPAPPLDILESDELKLLLVEPPDGMQEEIVRIIKELEEIRKEITGEQAQ
ncbi:MAG: nucleotidyl transferase AbiEii/AbiGii toxin family protein [Thermoplasmata archaeon]|nr:nucleotidyl transferase AbiEii/AbiGii toxin family protein [Thermoplasmata archaeon]MCK5397689.1 nucleotidyl transferase AbiEii/AbiGii toxin family protein [Thermoplasmata archaeon]